MVTPLSRGLPFELDVSWRATSLALEPEEGNMFLAPEFELPPLGDGGKDVILEYPLDLDLSDLRDGDSLDVKALDGIDSGDSSFGTVESIPDLDQPSDIWSQDLWNPSDDLTSRLRTWEAFEKKPVPNAERTAYLSEAGPAALDAALASKQAEDSRGVLPRDVFLRALCSLALGRSSIFFQWDDKQQTFSQTLQDIPAAGFSLECSHSLAAQIMDYGATYRRLQSFAEAPGISGRTCATVTALKRSIASGLEAVEAHISHSLPAILSPLQLQAALSRPLQVLEVLQSLQAVVKDEVGDEQAISAIADRVNAIVEAGSIFVLLLKALLARISQPWLNALSQDLALSGNQRTALHATRNEVGTCTTEDVDLSMAEATALGGETTSILSLEDRKLIKETKASLAILRQHFPDHDFYLVAPSSPADGHIHDGVSTTNNIPDLHAISPSLFATMRSTTGETVIQNHIISDTADAAWSDHATQMETFEAMDARISLGPADPHLTPTNELSAATASILKADPAQCLDFSLGLAPTLPSQPFDALRPLIKAQSSRLNTSLLRHLFQTCGLRKHFDVQHGFHLLGNGNFATRLSTALFSPETQSAERKRGTVPTSSTMGLRLGVRGESEGQQQSWPPASSELRLTLMGVLSESYHTDHDGGPTESMLARSSSKRARELPGGLSFAIRELPDAEIDRVMDPTSLYALDFLRLQYAAPAPLDALFTSGAMQQYDDVFRFLLRLMRVVDTVTRLHRAHVTSDNDRSGMAARRFAVAAQQFVAGLMGYVVHIGISAPWLGFQHALDGIEVSMTVSGSDGPPRRVREHIGIDELWELHSRCLDTVRSRLYLKRKQEGLRKAVDAVLTAILDGAAGRGSLAAFRHAVSTLVSALQGVVDRPLKGRGASVAAEEDAEMAGVLLARIDWNGFYHGGSGAVV